MPRVQRGTLSPCKTILLKAGLWDEKELSEAEVLKRYNRLTLKTPPAKLKILERCLDEIYPGILARAQSRVPRSSGRTSKPATRYASGVYPPRGGPSAQNMRMYSDPPRNRRARAHVHAALNAMANGEDQAIANKHIEEALNHLQANAPDAAQTAASIVEATNAMNAQNATNTARHVGNAREHLEAAENHHKSVSKGGGVYGWKACPKEAYNKSTTAKKVNLS
ncbi:hypothetical protein KFL_009420050 [Klebsormidium nitens]|uniref:Uncharacterized protein n=1 Tax=Klebsormidium nitens TaxID=105231 RepID=A0A1Y1INF0_KLENI|nr:hypothetical protein KFL_009420050 [Klebsormidium nitens]|eukprot:GAQ92193.1 hypothetical protein KFL_009420050 [Klebsormidium nitens]